MVSLAATSKKYRGRKAATYEAVRTKQERWKIENETVERMLDELAPSSVLDVPVGTGRFLQLYLRKHGCHVTGVDVSEEMLLLATAKLSRRDRTGVELIQGSADALQCANGSHDVAVCVRFLDLIDEDAMRKVVTELCRVTRRAIILTIRLGEKYVPKSNTAEHDSRKFRALVSRLGWRVTEEVPVFNAGWRIIRLERKS